MPAKTCPSGLQIDLTPLTGIDGRYLGKEELLREIDNGTEDYLLRNRCQLIAPGPYVFKGEVPDWDQLFIGDVQYILIALRNLSYPKDLYGLELRCGNMTCSQFKQKYVWDIDLVKLLDERVQALPEADATALRMGERLEIPIPDTDKKLYFRPKTRADRKQWQTHQKAFQTQASAKAKEEFNATTDGFTFWGIEISGVTRVEKKAFLESLPLSTLVDLTQAMEAHDCGLNTVIEVGCPVCKAVWDIELPFRNDFFTPTKRRARMEAKEIAI